MNKKTILFGIIEVIADIICFFMVSVTCEFLFSRIRIETHADWFVYGIYMIFLLAMFYFYELYQPNLKKPQEMMISVIISDVIALAGTLAVIALMRRFQSSMLFYLTVFAVSGIYFSALHYVIAMVQKRIAGVIRLLVLESDQVPNDLARKIKYSYSDLRYSWYEIVNEQDEAQLTRLMEQQFPNYDAIFVSPTLTEKTRNLFISRAVSLGKEIFMIPNLYNVNILNSAIAQFDDTPTIRIKPLYLTRGQRLLKRAMDIIISLIAVILSSPIMLICAIAVKVDSKGPVFYKQERMTINKKIFRVLKFRTMVQDAESVTGATLALEDDPRITRVGKVLRRLRLDELPQFLNILRGSMSIVGPRPERPVFVEQFIKEIQDYDKRYIVKAGLTGYAQIYGKYDTKPSDKLLFDLIYINQYSLLLDIKLILLTVKIMFVKESSAGVKEDSLHSAKAPPKQDEPVGVGRNE